MSLWWHWARTSKTVVWIFKWFFVPKYAYVIIHIDEHVIVHVIMYLAMVLFYMHLFTYSIVKSPWEANSFAASQEIPRISRNLKVHYRTHKRPLPVSILGQPKSNPYTHIPYSIYTAVWNLRFMEYASWVIISSSPQRQSWLGISSILCNGWHCYSGWSLGMKGVLYFVDRATLYELVNKTNLVHIFSWYV